MQDFLVTKKPTTRAQAGDLYAKGCLQLYYRRAFSVEEVIDTFGESRFLFGYQSSMCACEKYQEVSGKRSFSSHKKCNPASRCQARYGLVLTGFSLVVENQPSANTER